MMGQQGLPPGFRFSPTDEELVVHYLKNRACGKDFHQGVIAEVDIYKHEPWDLPEISALRSPDPVWYFFNAQDKRHSHTSRINRTTGKGYWKATGKDRKISCGLHLVGIKKTLIYYEGRAPSGKRTDWIMHEYKLDEEFERKSKAVCSITLCRIRKKGGPGPRNGEQFGAPIFAEYNEREDAEEDVDEKPLVLPDSKHEPSASSAPNRMEEAEVHGEVVLHDGHIEGCASNDLSHDEGLDTNTELDLHAFLEHFLASDTEATRIEPEMGSSHLVADATFADHHWRVSNPDLTDLLEMQSVLDLDGNTVHDLLQPTSSEEQILGELLHLADGGQIHASNVPSANNDGAVYGDFIELDDMNSPLDGFVMRSPLQGSYYITEEELESPFALLNGVEDFGGSSELLHSQGLAPRRARLQVAPPCALRMNGDMHRQVSNSPTKLHPEVYYREGSSDINIQIIGGPTCQSITSSSSGSNGDSEEICDIVESSQLSFLSKQPYMVTKCEEVPPQVFFAATAGSQDEEACFNDSKRVMLQGFESSISPENSSSGMQGESGNCESGLELRRGSFLNAGTCMQEAVVDCEVGLDSAVMRGAVSRRPSSLLPSTTLPSHGSSIIGELANKIRSMKLGGGFAKLESNLSTTFNNKVFALGKPVAQIVPSSDYTNPYCSLRRGAMSSLLRLLTAGFLLFFLFLGIHMITKYVLSMVARA